MKLSSLSKYLYLFVFLIIALNSIGAEESVDIWKKETSDNKSLDVPTKKQSKKKINILNKSQNKKSSDIMIIEETEESDSTKPVYGIFDPEKNNFSLDMWARTSGEEINSIFRRINKIQLSKSSESFFINTIMTYSYSPKDMSDDEFINLKINWLIRNYCCKN